MNDDVSYAHVRKNKNINTYVLSIFLFIFCAKTFVTEMKYNITILLSTLKNRFEEERRTKTKYRYRRKVANQWNGWHFKADMTYVAYNKPVAEGGSGGAVPPPPA